MSRYSPTVTPYVSKGIFSELNDAIQQGQETYRQRKHDEMLHENHAIDVYEHGVRSGTAPVESTADGTGSGLAGVLPSGPSPDAHPDFASALQQAFRAGEPGGNPSSTVADRGGQTPIPGTRNHAGGFDANTGSFGRGPVFETIAPPSSVVRKRFEQMDPAHYIDNEATPEARRTQEQLKVFAGERDLAHALSEGDRAQKVEAYVAAGVPREKAEMYVANPGLAENDPSIGKPLPPDPIAVHEANRNYDVKHPLPNRGGSSSSAENQADARIERWVQSRITRATASQVGLGGIKKPGMDYAAAEQAALTEARKLYGDRAVARVFPNAEASPTPPPAKASTGDINLTPTPDDQRVFSAAMQRIQSKKATVEQALASPSLSDNVKAMIRKQAGVK